MAYGFYLYWIALVFLLFLLLIFNVQSVADVRLYFGFAIKSNCLLWYQRTWTIMSLKNNNLLLYSTVNSYTVLFLCKKKNVFENKNLLFASCAHNSEMNKTSQPFFSINDRNHDIPDYVEVLYTENGTWLDFSKLFFFRCFSKRIFTIN